MKKRYYILLALTIGFMFAGAVTWGGLAGSGTHQEYNPFKLSGNSVSFKKSNNKLGVGTTTPAIGSEVGVNGEVFINGTTTMSVLSLEEQSATSTCSEANSKGMIMLSPDGYFYGCDGTAWRPLNNDVGL